MSDTASAPPAAKPGPLALFVLSVLVIAISALESMPLSALPLIQRELGLTPAQAGLLSTTLILTAAVAGPIVGRFGDLYGGRGVLLVIIWCVVVGGVVSAFAASFPVMLIGQLLQGFGFGFLPLSFALLRNSFPAAGMSVGIGLITGLYTVGGAAGVLGAGPLADALSRQWMFLLPTALVVLAGVLAPFTLPRTRVKGAGRVDWVGAVLLAALLSALMLGLSSGPQGGAAFWMLLGAVVVLGVCWVLVERRVRDPLIDLSMLGKPGMWSSCLISAVLGAGYGVMYFLIPQLVVLPPAVAGFGLGASMTDLSVYLLPSVLVAIVIGPASGYLVRKVGSRTTIVAGLLITSAGALMAIWWHSSPWQIVVILLLSTGIGVGVASTALYTGTVEAVTAEETGIATGINLVARSIGAAVGVQIVAVLLTAMSEPVTKLPKESAFQLGFALSAGAVLLALTVSYAVPSRARTNHVRPAAAV
ncbi:MFS transporter [Saccharopolyspora spinosa]|uniref:MFS transporter n=1 Tax=Saccharopolyspora spinosa TaxID=60894 RepID=A0A2N3Y8F6_SACSN|nr:MFS transporter [Saccharopolyspora spinosa]PKW19180.1 MFS transporter [Saccharopolyspora spinosa]